MSTDAHQDHIHVARRPAGGSLSSGRALRPLLALAIGATVVLTTGVGDSAARPTVPMGPMPTVAGPAIAPTPRGALAAGAQTAGPRARASSALAFPVGTPATWEASGMAPPAANALPNYALTYETDFSGAGLPRGWMAFTGQPGGDPGARWSPLHVSLHSGILQLHAWRDDAGNWVTGGVCQCGRPQTYGAFFVRSRVTGAGPSQVELLWPATNAWPPEVDFNETNGSVSATTSTDHWGLDFLTQHSQHVDLTKWHTFGVLWSPQQILYILDGRPWARITSRMEIPSIPMTLDLTQQTWCSKHWACPSQGETMGIDWVAEYTWVKPAS